MNHIKNIIFADNIKGQLEGAIEVEIYFENKTPRWCFFVNSEALKNFGDTLLGEKVRYHYGSPHMVVVAGELTCELIVKIITQLNNDGILDNCSLELNKI